MQNIQPYSRGAAWRSATILVAEDDAVFLRVFARDLEDRGYRVLCAENAIAAMKIAQESQDPIEILITDYFMPDFNGRELADRIAVLRPQTKVLYMTGYMQRLLPIMTDFESCAGTIFAKPVAAESIDGVIQSILPGRFKTIENS